MNVMSTESEQKTKPKRLPEWLRQKLPQASAFSHTNSNIQRAGLATVCEEALCPNRAHCWAKKTATYLALGKACTRRCGFCNIDYAKKPIPIDPQEPEKIAQSAKHLQLKHVVLTMVARDDLEDGGAFALTQIIRKLQEELPESTTEVLASDFAGNISALHTLLDANITIYNHNIETVERLSPVVRHKATYRRSLSMLKAAAEYAPHIKVKSGIMVGLGEQECEVKQTLRDLSEHGVSIVTIGQYLRPSRIHIPVKSYVTPKTFDFYRTIGESMGLFVYSGPFVRSSFNADEVFRAATQAQKKELKDFRIGSK